MVRPHIDCRKNQFNTAVDPQLAAVQTEVIICRHPPRLIGDMPVVAGTLPVPFLHMTSGGVSGSPMLRDDTVGPVRQCASDKNVGVLLRQQPVHQRFIAGLLGL